MTCRAKLKLEVEFEGIKSSVFGPSVHCSNKGLKNMQQA